MPYMDYLPIIHGSIKEQPLFQLQAQLCTIGPISHYACLQQQIYTVYSSKFYTLLRTKVVCSSCSIKVFEDSMNEVV